jgi:hypothetical protein
MAEQDIVKVAWESVELFNTGDWQRLRTIYTPNVVYEELATRRRSSIWRNPKPAFSG